MVQPLEPIFMLASVPGEVAGAAGTAMGAAVIALWRRVLHLEDRGYANQREILNGLNHNSEVLEKVVEMAEKAS